MAKKIAIKTRGVQAGRFKLGANVFGTPPSGEASVTKPQKLQNSSLIVVSGNAVAAGAQNTTGLTPMNFTLPQNAVLKGFGGYVIFDPTAAGPSQVATYAYIAIQSQGMIYNPTFTSGSPSISSAFTLTVNSGTPYQFVDLSNDLIFLPANQTIQLQGGAEQAVVAGDTFYFYFHIVFSFV